MAKRSKPAATETTAPEGGEGKIGKAEMIRQTAKGLGKRFRPRDIVAALKEKGVTVGYTQIAKALKAGGFRNRGKRKGAAPAGASASAANGAVHSGKVNKAQRIREVAKTMGKKVRPKDIIAELRKEGVHVTSAQVSTTLSAAGYRRSGIRPGAAAAGKPSAARAAGHALDIEALLAAKALIQKVGSIETAEEALRTLKRLS